MIRQEEGIGIRAARILIAHRNPLAAREVVEAPLLPGRDGRWRRGKRVHGDKRGGFAGSGEARQVVKVHIYIHRERGFWRTRPTPYLLMVNLSLDML